MKFNTKLITLVLVAITISTFTCAFLKRKNNGDPTPPNLQLPAIYQTKSDYAFKAVVEKKALEQVQAARALLTAPNAVAKQVLVDVANQLLVMWTHDNVRKGVKLDKSFQRSIFGGAWWGATNDDLANITWDGLSAAETQKRVNLQTARIGRVKNNNGEPIDNAGLLGICGDLGTAMFDADCTKNNDSYCKLQTTILGKYISDLKERNCFKEAFIPLAKGTRGGSAIAPNKKDIKDGNNKVITPAERGDFMEGGKKKKGFRSGLLTQTAEANEKFKAIWPWQMIPVEYMDKCAEPWAGHYSGSIVEVLYMMDFFTKTTGDKDHPMWSWKTSEYDKHMIWTGKAECKAKFDSLHASLNTQETNERKCKAALAGAFLISLGYHSAIEVKPTIWAYLQRGQIKVDPKIFNRAQDEKACDVNASKDMIALMKECTQK